MTAPWQPPWISTLLARRELGRLALDILVRSVLIVAVCELLITAWAASLPAFRGLWPPLAHVFLLSLLIPAPLYWLAFRPAAQRAARAAATSAGAQFQAVVEAVTDAILVSDSQGQVLFANPAAGMTFGCPQQTLLGRPLAQLLPAQETQASPEAGARFRAAPPEPDGRRVDGTLFPAEVSAGSARVAGEELRVTVVRDVTRRKETERELERLASFPRLDPNPILECDAAGHVTYANPAALRLLQELGGPEPAARLLPRDLPDMVRRCLEGCLDDCRAETEVNSRAFLWSLHPLPQLNRARVYGMDITERKRAEEALRESEEKYRLLLEHIPDVVWRTDSSGRSVFITSNVKDVCGFTAEEIYQNPAGTWFDRILAEHREGVRQAYAALFEEGRRFDIEYPYQRKDGQWIWLHERALAVHSVEGGLYADGVFSDVTARKRAEEKLRESEERFRSLVDALPVAVRVIQEGVVRFTNPAGAALFGYSDPAELKDVEGFIHVAAEDRVRLREYMEKRAAGEEAPAGYEYRGRRRDGSEFPADAVVARITFQGRPASLIVVRDLTERKRLRLFESLLPVCCVCGKVRDDKKTKPGKGSWRPLEEYVVEHSDADLTHTFCPACYRSYREKEGLPPAPVPESD